MNYAHAHNLGDHRVRGNPSCRLCADDMDRRDDLERAHARGEHAGWVREWCPPCVAAMTTTNG